MGLVKLGTMSLDGAKIKANASKHKALSWEYANNLEAQLQAEVEELSRLAEEVDNSSLPEQMDITEDLKRRKERLTKIVEAKAEIQARAQARFEQEQAEYEEKMARRKTKGESTGKKPGGRPPKAPLAEPRAKDQISLTDEDGLWHYQTRPGIPPVSTAGTRCCVRRVESCVYGMESEAVTRPEGLKRPKE